MSPLTAAELKEHQGKVLLRAGVALVFCSPVAVGWALLFLGIKLFGSG
ncbi:MAG: hypothetical protein KAY22_02900 [Rhizorhabdus sp.]|nr:hypothetical protein [Rhizorhabdus sp.]MBP8231229.1 hypothetical protein [Rhizorhabdus sp.]